MTKSTDNAALFNAGSGTAGLELLSGVIRAWDSKAKTNQVVVGGRTLFDLDVLVGPGTVEFQRGDVVGLLRVGYQLVILGKWLYADAGRIPAGILLPGSVETGNVQDGAVTEPKVGDGAVSTRTIAPQAVTTVKIAGQAVTLEQLADGSVDASKIVQASITSGLLADDAVTAEKLADGSVTGSAIAQDSIDSSKVSFTAGDIGGASVTLSSTAPSNPAVNDLWIDSGNGYVVKTWDGADWAESTATVADGSITAAKLADGSVSAAKLVAGAVGPDQLDDAVESDITAAQTQAAQALSDANNIGAGQLTDDAIVARTIAAGAVGAAAIAADAIVAGKIAAGTVGADELLANAVTAGKIAAGAVLAESIDAGAITAEKLATDAVVAGKIAAGAVTAGTIAAEAVGADQIAANAIVAGKIAAGVVGAEELAANSIIAGKIAAGAITGSKLSLGDGIMGNLVPDPGFESGSVPNYSTPIGEWYTSYAPGDAHTGNYYLYCYDDGTSAERRLQLSDQVSVAGGRSLTIGYWTRGPYQRDPTQRIGITIECFDAGNASLTEHAFLTFESISSGWDHCGYGDWVLPQDTASLIVYLDVYGDLTDNVQFDDVQVIANNQAVIFDGGGERIVSSRNLTEAGTPPFSIDDPTAGRLVMDQNEIRHLKPDDGIGALYLNSNAGAAGTGFGMVEFNNMVRTSANTAIEGTSSRAQVGAANAADDTTAVIFGPAVQSRSYNTSTWRDMAASHYNYPSDPALKADIEPLDTAAMLDEVTAAPVYRYRLVDDYRAGVPPYQRGAMSLDMPAETHADDDDAEMVSLDGQVATLWGAVQELAGQKDDLERRLAALEHA